MKKIESIRIVAEHDSDPDLSYLGEYASTPEEHHIDRQERGDCGRNEFRFFNAGCGDPDYIEQDYARAENYNRGEWSMIGVRAVAEITINGISQRIKSPGLWGVESDSDQEYLNEIGREELSQLRDMLAELGFSRRAISAAVKSADCEVTL